MKTHLNNGGTDYARPVKDGMANAIMLSAGNVTSQSRNYEAGAALAASAIPASSPSKLGEEAMQFGKLDLTRDGPDRLVWPTIQDYRMAAKPLSQLETVLPDAQPSRSSMVHSQWILALLLNATKTCRFYMTQWDLRRALWHFPVAQVPVALESITVSMMYYNSTTWDFAVWICGKLVIVFSDDPTRLILQLGDPGGNLRRP